MFHRCPLVPSLASDVSHTHVDPVPVESVEVISMDIEHTMTSINLCGFLRRSLYGTLKSFFTRQEVRKGLARSQRGTWHLHASGSDHQQVRRPRRYCGSRGCGPVGCSVRLTGREVGVQRDAFLGLRCTSCWTRSIPRCSRSCG